jgi:hypothetical protein
MVTIRSHLLMKVARGWDERFGGEPCTRYLRRAPTGWMGWGGEVAPRADELMRRAHEPL